MVVVFDLDDTLYNEVDFVRSGFEEVARYLGDKRYFHYMWEMFLEKGSGKIFNELIEKFSLPVSVEELVTIYRFHKPNISMPRQQIQLLGAIETPMALISDGHYLMQQNKFYALGLQKYILFPIFTHLYHTKKPQKRAFELVQRHFRNFDCFVYIADNPKKDFFAPKELGWLTIRYKNQYGIYKDETNNADYEVEAIIDVLDILKKEASCKKFS